MEEQLLPLPELEPAYEKAVWLYVFRDFSGTPEDLAAERICLRFGFTSYPQHHMVHPETFERLANTGRSVKSFLASVEKAQVGKISTSAAAATLAAADKRAAALEASGSVKDAQKALGDDDVVVRIRALQILQEDKPALIVDNAADLLKTPNDPLRYIVCKTLAKHGDEKAARLLEPIVETPKDSLNPNVLRIEAVKALGACGDAESVPFVAPHAASGVWRNGLTRISIEALLAIADRHKDARGPAAKALAKGYPPPPEANNEERPVLALAKQVHTAMRKLTGKRVAFPKTYDEEAREELIGAW